MTTRLPAVLRAQNIYDYSEFCSLCAEMGLEALDMVEWATKIKIYADSRTAFPDLEPFEAYMAQIDIVNAEFNRQIEESKQREAEAAALAGRPAPAASAPCGSCGGGTVR